MREVKTKKYFFDEDEEKAIKEKYKNVKITQETTSGETVGRYVSSERAAVLIFGNLKCAISPEMKCELVSMYFEAGKRVDTEIMDARLVETKTCR